jgi:hypothetical protein
MNLRDKTVPVIKTYIGGRWKVNFATGGFANQGQIFHNTSVEFRFKNIDSFFYYQSGATLAHSPITWRRVFTYPDSASAVEFYFENSGICRYGINRIQNDTLLIFDPGIDGFTYWLTRE